MAGCDGWITIKIFELLFATTCMIYKRVTDDESKKLFYFLQKYSREWPLLNSITWEENGAIFTDITYGGYIIIIIGLIIGQCSGELQRCKKTENFFLSVGALLFIAAGSLELAALESVEERLVDNAAILGVLSLFTGFLFIIDLLSASKRRKREKLRIIQKYTQSIPTQTEEKLSELTKTSYLNGNIQNGKAHTVTETPNGNRIPSNAVKLLPSSPILNDSALIKMNNDFVGRVLYPAELPIIDGNELKTHEGRVKSTESFLRSEKGYYPKVRKMLESDRSNNDFFIPTGYVLVPSEQVQGKAKSKSDSGVGDSPTPPGYAKIISDAKGKPGYVIIPIDQSDVSRKLQSPATSTTIRDSPEFYYLERQDGKSRSSNLYRSTPVMNSSDISDAEEPIKQQFQKMPSKYAQSDHRKFVPQSEDSSDERKTSYPSEIHFARDSRHSSRSLKGSKEWHHYSKGKINEAYAGDKENGFSYVANSPYHSRMPSPDKPKSILRFDYDRTSKKEAGLYMPEATRCDSLDSQKIAEELKNLREITKPDADLELEKENRFLKERLKFETKEKKKLRHELEDRKKQLIESEEEKNRRISEREEQYFGIKDLKQSHEGNSGKPRTIQLGSHISTETQQIRKGAKEINEKLKQKYLEHESKAAREAQEFRDLIDERFHFLHEEDKKRKNLSPRRKPVPESATSEAESVPNLTSHSSSSKFQKSDSDEMNSSSTDEDVKLRVETPGSYKSEALFWLGSDRDPQDKDTTPTTPGSPGYVLYTAQNWPESPSPEDRFQFSAKEAQQLTLKTPPKTPLQDQIPSEFEERKNSQKLHLLEFEEVPESVDKSSSLRKGLLIRKVDFPKEPVIEVKKPPVVHGSTSTWRRWLYPKPKVQHSRSVPN